MSSPSSSEASSTRCPTCGYASSESRTCPRCPSTSPASWTPSSSSAPARSSASWPIRGSPRRSRSGGRRPARTPSSSATRRPARSRRRHGRACGRSWAAIRTRSRLARWPSGGGGDGLTGLALDDPQQWSLSWTSFPDVYSVGVPRLDNWAATVDVMQPERATEAFFPTIAREGLAYNLLLLKKVPVPDVGTWRELLGDAWTAALDAAADAGLLYVIDLRIYETLQPQQVGGLPRFTPSTVVVLTQDPATKALTPELIRVAGGGNQPKLFSRQGSTTPSAWVYAPQAAKVSMTVYGIWLGHVYHWHIVTAAMQMTMFKSLSASNPARRLLEPHSSYLIPFDDVLFLKWSAAAPPTSIASAWQYLELLDLYTEGREFFDDDPTTALQQLGLTESDFTVHEP